MYVIIAVLKIKSKILPGALMNVSSQTLIPPDKNAVQVLKISARHGVTNSASALNSLVLKVSSFIDYKLRYDTYLYLFSSEKTTQSLFYFVG